MDGARIRPRSVYLRPVGEPETSEMGGATCARHTDRPALGPCTRCGDFVCRECLGDGIEGRCERCNEREGGRLLAWERTQLGWRRYPSTIAEAFGAPTRTFGQTFRGAVGPAARFAWLSSMVGFSPLFALVGVFIVVALVAPDLWPSTSGETRHFDPAILCFGLPCAALFYPSLSFVYFSGIGLVHHGLARLLGGHASLSQSMRAAYYTSAWEPLSAALMLTYVVPLLGLVAVLGGYFGSGIWRAFALKAFGERGHGLSPGAATLAAVAASFFWQCVLGLPLFAVVGFAIWQRFGR